MTEIVKHPVPQPYPPYIDMGACLDCTLDWRMSKSEYTHWITERIPRGLSMPKRCSDCRAKRKESQMKFGEDVRRKRGDLGQKVRDLATEVQEGVHDGSSYELAMLLLSIAEEFEKIPEKYQDEKFHKKGYHEKGKPRSSV